MNKLITKILLITAVLGSIVIFYRLTREPEACFGYQCYKLEVARTQAEREKGLMFREKLDKSAGMLFIFDKEDIYPFWMENTLIPLDIIWLDENYKVVYIFKKAQPCGEECENIMPDKAAQYVLELNAGEADRIKIKEGDELRFKKL